MGASDTITRLSDPLMSVFTPEVRLHWTEACDPAGFLGQRLQVLAACGPDPSHTLRRLEAHYMRATKAAWATYLEAAFACEMFEGDRGADLRSRLIGTDEDGFRSAMAECMTCWFFAGRLGLAVRAEAKGRKRKNLDLRVDLPGGQAGVEVKAPFREPPKPAPGYHSVAWHGDDTDKISQCLESANKQFDDKCRNILVIVPRLRGPMFSHRQDLVKATYGQTVLKGVINLTKGRLEDHYVEFSPQGKFLATTRPNGALLKPDGLPAYRRVGALLCIEPYLREKHPSPIAVLIAASEAKQNRAELLRIYSRMWDLHTSNENEIWMDHYVLVLHNPCAYHPIGEDVFSEFPQMVPQEEAMAWTDGYECFV